MTALHLALRHLDPQAVLNAVHQGHSPYALDETGQSAWAVAVDLDRLAVVLGRAGALPEGERWMAALHAMAAVPPASVEERQRGVAAWGEALARSVEDAILARQAGGPEDTVRWQGRLAVTGALEARALNHALPVDATADEMTRSQLQAAAQAKGAARATSTQEARAAEGAVPAPARRPKP